MAEQITGLIANMQEQPKLQIEQFQAILGQLAQSDANQSSGQPAVNVPRFEAYNRKGES